MKRRPLARVFGIVLLLIVGALGEAQPALAGPNEDGPATLSGAADAAGMRARMSEAQQRNLPGAPAEAAHVVANAADVLRYEYQYRVACSGSPQNPGRTSICAEALVGCDPADPGPLTLVFRRTVTTTGAVVRDWELIANTCHPGDRLGQPALTLAHIRTAFTSLPWATLSTGMQPPNQLTLVTVPVYYQVQWSAEGVAPGQQVAIDPARMLGYRVDIRPVLVGYTYHFGDDTNFGPTPDPGGTYPDGGITHPYAKAGTYAVRIDATLSAHFRIAGGPWTRIPDHATITGTPTSMTVKTARAVLVQR